MSNKRRPTKRAPGARARPSTSARPASAPGRRAAARAAVTRRRQMRNVAAGVLGALFLGGVITLAVVGHGSTAGSDTSPGAFVLPGLGTPGKVSLASFRGRPVVVNFFASWCTVCASELPVFAQDAQALRGQVDFVEVDALETGNGLGFAQRYHLSSSVTAVARDVGGSQGNGLYQALGGNGSMPMTAFYSAQGHLLSAHIGGFDATTLASQLHQFYGITP
ncbi:MAG: TlpA disulfide reductase family protein [Acidimicrobiales bacterium]